MRHEGRNVEFDCCFEAGEEWIGWGLKQKENILERNVCSGGRHAQIMETFASREDQTAASAFVSIIVLEFSGGMRGWMM